MKSLIFLLCLIASIAEAQPKAEIFGPFQIPPRKYSAIYSGLTNTLFGSVNKFGGDYRLDFFIDEEHTNYVENDARIEVTPILGKDEGKTAILRLSIQNSGQQSFTVLREDTFKIQPPPLIAVADGDIEEGDYLTIKAWLGTEGNLIDLPDGLELKAVPGYFAGGIARKKNDEPKDEDAFFTHTQNVRNRVDTSNGSYDGIFFEFMPLPSQIKVPEKGTYIDVEVVDPLTQQARFITCWINPKRTTPHSNESEKK